MQIKTGSLPALADAEIEAPDLADFIWDERTRPLSLKVLEMLAERTDLTLQVCLDFPETSEPDDLEPGNGEDPSQQH